MWATKFHTHIKTAGEHSPFYSCKLSVNWLSSLFHASKVKLRSL
jgi:hypothetical protein